MTKLLEKAFKRVSTELSPKEQDQLAHGLVLYLTQKKEYTDMIVKAEKEISTGNYRSFGEVFEDLETRYNV